MSSEVQFVNPIAIYSGADIRIWESSAGNSSERSLIEVSQDGLGYLIQGWKSQLMVKLTLLMYSLILFSLSVLLTLHQTMVEAASIQMDLMLMLLSVFMVST